MHRARAMNTSIHASVRLAALVLAFPYLTMKPRIPILLGVVAGGALAYEAHARRGQQAVERFAAAALETLLNAIEANDAETGMHVRRVAACALIIADAAGLDERAKRAVERVALFHDIGKIHEALFDIIHDPKRLDCRRAPRGRDASGTWSRGARPACRVLSGVAERSALAPRALGRKGISAPPTWPTIPLEARIVTIADTFDAITHARRYRGAAGVGRAAEVLEGGRGTQFDPELADLALLPPVIEEMAEVQITSGGRDQKRRGARRENIPDVSFRWRSASLRSARVTAPREIE